MNSDSPGAEPKVTADLMAEAAAWLAVLHGPSRTSATERGFQQWLKKSAHNAQAFEEATAIWEEAGNLPRPKRLHGAFKTERGRQSFLQQTLAAAALLVIATVGAFIYVRNAGIQTGVGEQRVLALEDGTQVILNTDTRVLVSYDRNVRKIELKEGEALFEVAKRPDWPFVVIAGEQRVEALGTSFVVRRDEQQLAVTLVEGKVAIAPANASARAESAATSEGANVSESQPSIVVLSPGQRLMISAGAPPEVDEPSLDKVLAWQRREVAFDDTSLADAIAEMNRYSRKPLVLVTPEAASARVTGLFRAGDSLSFARAVGEAYQLEVAEEGGRIVLGSTAGVSSAL